MELPLISVSTEEEHTVVGDNLQGTDKETLPTPTIEEHEQFSLPNTVLEKKVSSEGLEMNNQNMPKQSPSPILTNSPDVLSSLENTSIKETENVAETTSDSQPIVAGLQGVVPEPQNILHANEKSEKTSEADSANVDCLPDTSDSVQTLVEKDEEYHSCDDSDSVGEEDNDDVDKEEVAEEEEESDYDDSRSESEDSTAESLMTHERESGDGQESEKKGKKLDHDEDKRDPQYIPKKGNFYEHDDRTSDNDEQPEVRKKFAPLYRPVDDRGRWKHDKYDEDLQSPKTKEELIDQYGYNIRDEEGPPKARRRRRYGRGPNKYTRSWEELDAYNKLKGVWRHRGGDKAQSNSVPSNREEEDPTPAEAGAYSGKAFSAQDRLKRFPKTEKKQDQGPTCKTSVQDRLNKFGKIENKQDNDPTCKTSVQDRLNKFGKMENKQDNDPTCKTSVQDRLKRFGKMENKQDNDPICKTSVQDRLRSLDNFEKKQDHDQTCKTSVNDRLKKQTFQSKMENKQDHHPTCKTSVQDRLKKFNNLEKKQDHDPTCKTSVNDRLRRFEKLENEQNHDPSCKSSVQGRLKKYEKIEQDNNLHVVEKHVASTKTLPLKERERDVLPNNLDMVSENIKKDISAPSVRKTFIEVIEEEQRAMASSRSPFIGRGRARGRYITSGIPRSSNSSAQMNTTKNNSSADDDIAALSQHFSDAVINVDNKSIKPINTFTRPSSLPPTTASPSTSSAESGKQATTSQAMPQPTSTPVTNEQKDATPVEKTEGKSKRYSSQRQRLVPTLQPPVSQQPVQLEQAPPAQSFIPPTDQFFHQGTTPVPTQFSQPPPPPPAQFTSEVPLLTFIPPAGQFPPPLYVPPPPYLPPAPLPVQQAPPPQPEVYQGASGITYYNTQAQVNQPVSTSRRVKLAIPIVAPPDSN